MQYNQTVGCADIHIDTKRIDNNIRNAQKLLNMQVVADCDEYIPMAQEPCVDRQIIQMEYMADRWHGIPHMHITSIWGSCTSRKTADLLRIRENGSTLQGCHLYNILMELQTIGSSG